MIKWWAEVRVGGLAGRFSDPMDRRLVKDAVGWCLGDGSVLLERIEEEGAFALLLIFAFTLCRIFAELASLGRGRLSV
jgi:hypothetical protein